MVMFNCSFVNCSFAAVDTVDYAGDVADSGSQKVFGGSVSSVGFGQSTSKNAGQAPAVFGSISAIGRQVPAASSAFVSSTDTSSVFGSSLTAVGFADLLPSGSNVAGFGKKSGELLTYSVLCGFYYIAVGFC